MALRLLFSFPRFSATTDNILRDAIMWSAGIFVKSIIRVVIVGSTPAQFLAGSHVQKSKYERGRFS
jgi:hypothetical protein